jgi:hypothetical protein
MAQDNSSAEGTTALELEQDALTQTSFEAARDEQGRFAAREGDRGAERQGDGRPPTGFVPQEALHAAREEARRQKEAFDREMAELRGFVKGSVPKAPEPEKKPAPSWWEQPDDAVKYHLDEFGRPIQEKLTAFETQLKELREKDLEAIRQQRLEDREELSKERAIDKHGEEAVNAAFTAFKTAQQADPQGMRPTYEKIMASRHMYGELIKWHQEQSVLTKVGADPEAYIEAEVQKRLAALTKGAAPPAGGDDEDDETAAPEGAAKKPGAKTALKLPSNLATARNAGARTTQTYGGPRPLSEIMGR